MELTSHNQGPIGPKPPCVIIAGGQSRRMGGREKAFLDIEGAPLLQHVMDRIAPSVSDVALNANGDVARFAAFDMPVLADQVDGYLGPLAGIATALHWACSCHATADWLMTVSSDTPFLPLTLVDDLVRAAEKNSHAQVLVPVSGGRRHFLCGLWRTNQREALETALVQQGVRAIKDWLSEAPIVEVAYESTPIDPFFNINTEQDLDLARNYVRSGTAL